MYRRTRFMNDYMDMMDRWVSKRSSYLYKDDVWDEESKTLHVSMAGANQENTSVDVVDNTLIIKSETEHFGKVKKSWTIGKVTDIDVTFKDGVITLDFTFKDQTDININYK